MENRKFAAILYIGILLFSLLACASFSDTGDSVVVILDRESVIPEDAIKMSSETDLNIPLSFSDEYEHPVPVPGLVNTAGAEDSPFISPDGKTLYFWFTPVATIPAEEQIFDGVTGIYFSEWTEGGWGEAERIVLQDSGKLAGDGCAFVQDDLMLFCSAREGYTGMNWFQAEFIEGTWKNWEIVNFNPDYEVGELHITGDGAELYFASERPGGAGGMDVWVSESLDGEWQYPNNVSAVNTADHEGWPAISPDGNELWFNRNFGIWRSVKVDGVWQMPQMMFSALAGEPSIDQDGNLYFTHHFFLDNAMVEADIYVAYRK